MSSQNALMPHPMMDFLSLCWTSCLCQIRVMVRISSSGSDSSDFLPVLKVDGRKKQLSLCETSSGVQRRSATSDPKTFTFDAIFAQDTSQVRLLAVSISCYVFCQRTWQ